jgi:hypothetical protein
VQQVFQYLYNEDDNENDVGSSSISGGDLFSKSALLPPIACQDWELLHRLNDLLPKTSWGHRPHLTTAKDVLTRSI